MNRLLPKYLLWIDCTAGALVGVLVLSLSDWLSRLQGLPRGLLLLTGAANLLYACYSLSLAIRLNRPLALIALLVAANLAWAGVCVALGLYFARSATIWGLSALFGEALFVGGLALLEWRWRDALRVAES
jgi:hypothetical protein